MGTWPPPSSSEGVRALLQHDKDNKEADPCILVSESKFGSKLPEWKACH